LAKKEYLIRLDKVRTHFLYSTCKSLGTEPTEKWYTHTVLWNQSIHTDREVTVNMPDILNKNKEEKTSTLIDVTIPADRNIVQKEAEKKLKYKSFYKEILRLWNMRCRFYQ